MRAKIATIRKNIRAFQAQQRHSIDVVDEGLTELDDAASTELDDALDRARRRGGRVGRRPARRGRPRPRRGRRPRRAAATRRLPERAGNGRRQAGLRRPTPNWSGEMTKFCRRLGRQHPRPTQRRRASGSTPISRACRPSCAPSTRRSVGELGDARGRGRLLPGVLQRHHRRRRRRRRRRQAAGGLLRAVRRAPAGRRWRP